MSTRKPSRRKGWVNDVLERMDRFADEKPVWCGLYYPCLCSGRVREVLAEHMEAATGIQLDLDALTRKAALALAKGLSEVSPEVRDDSNRARRFDVLMYELEHNSGPYEDEVSDVLGDTWAASRFRGAVHRRGNHARILEGEQRIAAEHRTARANAHAERQRQKAPRDEQYRERARRAAVEGDLAALPMSSAARRRLRPEYLQTAYVAELSPGTRVTLRHGQTHAELDRWMSEEHPEFRHWVFITAWNPFSEPQADSKNRAAQERLRAVLRERGWPFVEGVGELGDWREESLLVLVPTRRDGLELGQEFQQAAVLIGRRGGHSAVVPCPAGNPAPRIT